MEGGVPTDRHSCTERKGRVGKEEQAKEKNEKATTTPLQVNLCLSIVDTCPPSPLETRQYLLVLVVSVFHSSTKKKRGKETHLSSSPDPPSVSRNPSSWVMTINWNCMSSGENEGQYA
jgi:hypothetical protein